jgi:hypothetical protein
MEISLDYTEYSFSLKINSFFVFRIFRHFFTRRVNRPPRLPPLGKDIYIYLCLAGVDAGDALYIYVCRQGSLYETIFPL